MRLLPKKKGVKRVMISCCSNRNPDWGMVMTLQGALQQASKRGISSTFRPRVGESEIVRARQNDLVPFMQQNFDYLFSVDDDVELPDHAIWKLLENDKDICAGVYRLKEDEPHTAVRLPMSGPGWPEVFKEKLVTPAIYVSTGCMMIKRCVVERMIEAHPELKYKRNVIGDGAWGLYMTMIYQEEYLSEDWAFCQRAKDAGFEVWVDGGVRCNHWGKRKYGFDEG